jgi:hypothetical protein
MQRKYEIVSEVSEALKCYSVRQSVLIREAAEKFISEF